MTSSLKRGKFEEYDDVRRDRERKTDAQLSAGIEMREYLLDEFIAGELNNTQIATIADMHQRNGGTGLECFARSSSSHAKQSVVKNYIQALMKPFFIFFPGGLQGAPRGSTGSVMD